MAVIEIEDPKKKKKKQPPAPAPSPTPEGEEYEKKRELWPLIPAIPVVLAIILSLIPETKEIPERQITKTHCIRNLYMIMDMKRQYAKSHNLAPGDPCPPELLQQLKEFQKCPEGGVIKIQSIGREPRCSRHGTPSEWEQQNENMATWYEIIEK